MPRIAPALLFALTLLSACGGGEPRLTERQRELRRESRRQACITEALERRARTQLARLDTILQQNQARGEVPALVRAPHTFAQVYHTYADLRAHEAAYTDSAFQATSKEDSTRYTGMSDRFRVNNPSPGSVEEGAIRSYLRDFESARTDPDFPCNRLVEDPDGPREEG